LIGDEYTNTDDLNKLRIGGDEHRIRAETSDSEITTHIERRETLGTRRTLLERSDLQI
jgi:hypothetical protein